jgi:hypothetical protein
MFFETIILPSDYKKRRVKTHFKIAVITGFAIALVYNSKQTLPVTNWSS